MAKYVAGGRRRQTILLIIIIIIIIIIREQIGIKNRIRTMQKSALLGSAHILRKVMEVQGLGRRPDWKYYPREKTL